MSYQQLIEKIKPDFEKVISFYKKELQKIRSGGISIGLIEEIQVECFGSNLPLKQLGAISVLSPREVLIQLWDKSYIEKVVKAIEERGFDVGIRVDGNNVYLTSPPPTRETREKLIKLLKEKQEIAFQKLRHLRDKVWKEIQEGFQKGEIREDDKYKGKEKLDEITREYREKVEQITQTKEKEIIGS